MSKSLKNNKVYLIVLVATMAAMAIALEKIGSLKVTPSIKITFYAIPLMVVGILHGPKLGALAGLVSGIVFSVFVHRLCEFQFQYGSIKRKTHHQHKRRTFVSIPIWFD